MAVCESFPCLHVKQKGKCCCWQGLDVLAPSLQAGNLARPRSFEIGAALNRLRTLKMRQL
jgi:hypothetical protein